MEQFFEKFAFYNTLKGIYDGWAISQKIPAYIAFIVACVLVLAILIVILVLIFKPKKKKIKFVFGDDKFVVVSCKKNKEIKYPEVNLPEGCVAEGWFKDQNFEEEFTDNVFVGKKNFSVYLKYSTVEVEDTAQSEEEVLVDKPVENAEETTVEEKVEEVQEPETIEEEKVSKPKELYTVGEIYDDLREQILSYERVKSLAKYGIERKQYIAEMFERDEKIYLFLAVDPDLMKARGYNVKRTIEPEFESVPCEMVLSSGNDLQIAYELIDETMKFNFLVRSIYHSFDKKVSDEATRKNGFAFFIKNENIATTAADYYKLLRASTLSYGVSENHKEDGKFVNKIVLKLFKNNEDVYLYLALDAEKESLEFVGYDRNFADTPAMFQVKSSEDVRKANILIDKLMYQNDMVRYPEKVEVDFDEVLENSCGFGYRVRY